MAKLVVFDYVSTITLDDALYLRLHKLTDSIGKANYNYEKMLNNELSEKEMINRNAVFHEGVTRKCILKLAGEINLQPDFYNVINQMDLWNIKTAIVTSDYEEGAVLLQRKVKIDYVYGCRIKYLNGRHTGKLEKIVDETEKPEILKEICNKENISLGEVAYVGNGRNDLPAMSICGLKIGFRPEKEIREISDYIVNRLTDILDIINNPIQ